MAHFKYPRYALARCFSQLLFVPLLVVLFSHSRSFAESVVLPSSPTQKIFQSKDASGRFILSDLPPSQKAISRTLSGPTLSTPPPDTFESSNQPKPAYSKSISFESKTAKGVDDASVAECKKATFNLKLLETGQKIRSIDGKESKVLSEEETIQMKRVMLKSVQLWCQPSASADDNPKP